MLAKEYLQQIKRQEFIVRTLNDEVEEIIAKLGIKAYSYNDEPPSQGGNPKRMEYLIYKKIELQDEMDQETRRLCEMRKETIERLNTLPEVKESEVLYKRYLKYQSWERIARDMNYSIRQVQRIHGEALVHLTTLID